MHFIIRMEWSSCRTKQAEVCLRELWKHEADHSVEMEDIKEMEGPTKDGESYAWSFCRNGGYKRNGGSY